MRLRSGGVGFLTVPRSEVPVRRQPEKVVEQRRVETCPVQDSKSDAVPDVEYAYIESFLKHH